MQNDIEEKRIQTYRSADETVRALYSDLDLGATLGSTSGRLQMDDHAKRIFIDIIGDIILGFYPKSDLKRLLVSEVGVTEEVAQKIELDLKDFLARIDGVPTIPEASKDVREKLELRPEASASGQGGASAVGPKPLTREQVMQALAPKRTMPSDIATAKQGDVNSEQKK